MERLPTTVLCIAIEILRNSVNNTKQIAGVGTPKGVSLIMNIFSSTVYKYLKHMSFMVYTNSPATWQIIRMNSYRKCCPCRDQERGRSARLVYCACCTYYVIACAMQSSGCSRYHVVHWLRVLPLDCTCKQIATQTFDKESCLALSEQEGDDVTNWNYAYLPVCFSLSCSRHLPLYDLL